MASDAQVTSKMVLDALRELGRRGTTEVRRELEAAEPGLAEHRVSTAVRHLLGPAGRAITLPPDDSGRARQRHVAAACPLRALARTGEQTPLAQLDPDAEDDGGEERAGDLPPPELT